MQLLSLIFWFALGAAQQTASGSVEGTVSRLGPTAPIEGVQVTLTGTLPLLAAVVTDKEGHFSFPNVAPGRYTIRFQRDGYLVPGSSTAAVVNVGSGQNVTGLTYYLLRGGTISGRILDPLGRPSVAATVYALRLAYQEGRPTLLTTKSTSSNDRGEYRIFWLEPGDYYVRAEKTLPAGPARAYYPGTDNAGRAVKVRVAEGIESPKVDISIQKHEARKISGIVTTIVASLENSAGVATTPVAGQPVDREVSQAAGAPQFYLSPLDTDGVYDGPFAVTNALTTTEDRLAGRFEIPNVRSGTYNLIVVLTERTSTPVRHFMGKALVDVGFEDARDITVDVVPGRDLRGRVVYDRISASPADSSVRVQLRPRDLLPIMALTANLSAAVAADGTFTIPNVPDLQYSVSVSPLPQDAYIADLKQGSFSVFDVGTVVIGRRGNDDLEVIVDSPGAIINGKVAASAAQLGAGITAALVPDERRQENLLLYKRTNASEAGVFSFTGVAPGRYRLFAWESIPAGAEFNAEFMDAFRDDATEITVTPGDTTAVELRLIRR